MIQLLFSVLGLEVALVLVLLFKTPLRKVAILGLDRLKRGRGPVMVKTVAATVMVVLGSSGYSIFKIHDRSNEMGQLTPTDQVLASRHLLEASLMGYSLFLALVIDRLHHYIRELRSLRKSMEVATKLNRAMEDAKSGSVESQEKEITGLKEEIEKLKSQLHTKEEEVKSAEASSVALRKQSEGLLLEYDRLLEDNQHLRSQIQSIDLKLSHSDGNKKDT
ncbi:B-cell receptor-associated 31-like [Rhynchospora pubera]|uniref:Endoplasmic reticulum transmembrane protein n=1 Tax=Rhynchospora pubera TaxID=906938 RepID=A0AAV8FTW5_9POAL|nr:B-cell receptor-associated 31-like [Rhynchospora pubera]KAJ4794382.1 B-cell receptor-associated 31-like [Rhynchospora pubera]KAJ4818215.1 B-cell receptor-associated 31-like [Rhynchospora pubera]